MWIPFQGWAIGLPTPLRAQALALLGVAQARLAALGRPPTTDTMVLIGAFESVVDSRG